MSRKTKTKKFRSDGRELDVTRLRDISHTIADVASQVAEERNMLGIRGKARHSIPDKAYVDRERGWVVQVRKKLAPDAAGTPWEGTLTVAVSHTAADNHEEFHLREAGIPITWDELQAIKDHFWPDRIGIEIYPPHDQIVNVANMRWLWVLPKGATLPFNLGSKTTMKS